MIKNSIIRKSFAILALSVAVALPLVACTKEEPEPTGIIIMTTKAVKAAFYVVVTGDITINWGDGKVSNLNDGIFHDLSNWFWFGHEYSGTTAHNIVITGYVSLLYCQNNELTALDVTKNTVLTELNCSNNQLTSLDVSKNIALTDLVCNYNQLTILDVSKNSKLNILSCVRNKLTAAALDDLFGTLPYLRGYDYGEVGGIYISTRNDNPEFGNPGIFDCDRSIAQKRGWSFFSIR